MPKLPSLTSKKVLGTLLSIIKSAGLSKQDLK